MPRACVRACAVPVYTFTIPRGGAGAVTAVLGCEGRRRLGAAWIQLEMKACGGALSVVETASIDVLCVRARVRARARARAGMLAGLRVVGVRVTAAPSDGPDGGVVVASLDADATIAVLAKLAVVADEGTGLMDACARALLLPHARDVLAMPPASRRLVSAIYHLRRGVLMSPMLQVRALPPPRTRPRPRAAWGRHAAGATRSLRGR